MSERKGREMRDKTGRFVEGYTPWNKEKKGIHISPETEFKTGHIPAHKGKHVSEEGRKNIEESNQKRIKYPELHDKEWLYQKYWTEELSQYKIAEIVGCNSHRQVGKAMKRMGIETRTRQKKHFPSETEFKKERSAWNKGMFGDITKFRDITSEEEAYWFGFIVGDGTIGKYSWGYRLKVALQKGDIGHLRKLSSFLGFNGSRIYCDGANLCAFSIKNKEIVTNLFNLGLVQNKVHKVHRGLIPMKYKRDFIRGLLDADGTVYVSKIFRRFSLKIYGRNDLLEGIREVLIDEIDSFTDRTGCITSDKNVWALGYSGRWNAEKFGHYLYDDAKVFLDRKYQKAQELFEYNKSHPRALTTEEVRGAREIYKKGFFKRKQIAEMFGISQSYMNRILNNKRRIMS